jgi:hypothetical protein
MLEVYLDKQCTYMTESAPELPEPVPHSEDLTYGYEEVLNCRLNLIFIKQLPCLLFFIPAKLR